MNKVEQFIAVYAPKDDALFRKRLEQVIQEIKNKTQPTNEVIGMRDYFAAKAMVALTQRRHPYEILKEEYTKDIYKAAYKMADAMMEARK